MTTGGEDDGPLFMFPAATTIAGRRREGPNYPVFLAAATFIALAALAAFWVMRPQVTATPSLTEARSCLMEHDIQCAAADLQAYLKKYPNDAAAAAQLAIILTKDGQHKEAIPYYRRANSLGVATYDFYANYANSLNAVGQTDEAIKMNYATLRLVPQLVDVRGQLADELVRRGRAKEALTLLETFDQSLEDQGQPRYFTPQIEQIKTEIAGTASQGDHDRSIAGPGVLSVPLEASGRALIVPVSVDDAMTLKFVVDSGASDVTIPADVARTLMRLGKLNGYDFLGQRMFTLADGSRRPSRLFMIHSMRIGGHEVRDVVAAVPDTDGPLLLGQSFLNHFKSWSIDNRRKVLVLQK